MPDIRGGTEVGGIHQLLFSLIGLFQTTDFAYGECIQNDSENGCQLDNSCSRDTTSSTSPFNGLDTSKIDHCPVIDAETFLRHDACTHRLQTISCGPTKEKA